LGFASLTPTYWLLAVLSCRRDFNRELSERSHGSAIATEVAPTGFPQDITHKVRFYDNRDFRAHVALLRQPESADAGYSLPAVLAGLRDMRGIHAAQCIDRQRGSFGERLELRPSHR
jgi:hypothetical protein